MSLSHQPQFSESNVFPPSLSLVITWIKSTINVKRAAISTFRNMSGDQEEVKRKKATARSLGNMIHSSFLQLEWFLVHKTNRAGLRLQENGGWWRLLSHVDLRSRPHPPHPFLRSFVSPTSYLACFAINKENICLLA